MSADPSAIESAFHAARAAAPADRAAVLAALPPEVREPVERLLAADADLNEPNRTSVHSPAPERTDAHTPRADAGTVVAGRYKLLQQIGEGGMGTVWMADQTDPVKRRVAVKLIRIDRGNSQAVLARFAAERQAIALMDHPHIAKLLDAGTTAAGEPYFVMELVKGIPLAEFCDQHRLSVPDRLKLFLQICGAVQHAHQKGIIHRDLKPSNVLVESHDGKPVPKVIDFGLAKATSGLRLTEHSLFTAFGNVMGTPLYMAPEQANFNAVDIDTRADVYALGVILYELLTGTTPLTRESFKKAALDEMLKLIREQDAPTPSSRLSEADAKPSVAANRQSEPAKLGRFVKGELDWITLKALSKERDRRYESAAGFAKDVERFLNHEPVAAGPVGAGYRLRKFVRRNRPQVVAASLLTAALSAGFAGTTAGWVRAVRAEANAGEQARIAGEERDRADARFVLASDAVAVYLSKVTQDEDLKESDFNALRRRLIESAVPFYRKLSEERQGATYQRANQALAHLRLGDISAEMGDPDTAVREAEAARAIFDGLPAEDRANPVIRQEAAECLSSLCQFLIEARRYDRAFEVGSQARTAFAGLVAETPTAVDRRVMLAEVYYSLARIEADRGRYRAAVELYDAAIDIEQKLAAEFPLEPKYRGKLAYSLTNQGNQLKLLGSTAAAEERYTRATAIHDELAAQFPRVRSYRIGTMASRINFATILHERGEFARGQRMGLEALDIGRKLVADFPTVSRYRTGVADVLLNLGIASMELRQPDAAERYYRESIAVKVQAAKDFPGLPEFRQGLIDTHLGLGILYTQTGRAKDAQVEFDAAVSVGQQLVRDFPKVPEYRLSLANSHNGLSGSLHFQGREADSRKETEKALAICERLVADFPDVPSYRVTFGMYLHNVGNEFIFRGKPAEAIEWFDKAIRTLEVAAGQLKGNVLAVNTLRRTLQNRAKALDQLQRFADADKDWARVMDLTPEAERSGMRMSRACSRVRAGQFDAPLREVEELIEARASTPGSGEAGSLYDAACAYGLAARPNDSIPAVKQEEYAKRAVELLSRAVAKGYRNIDHIKVDRDLTALHGRADYRRLIARLEGKVEVAPPPRPVK